MSYYTQDFTNNSNNASVNAYGLEGAHDHGKSIQFSKDIKDYLMNTAKWSAKDIREGKFMSKQPQPAHGKLFVWKETLKKWVKA